MEYFFAINGAQSPAMDEAATRAAIADGRITGDTLAWTAGMAQWTAARSVPDLVGRFPQLLAPTAKAGAAPPPLGQVLVQGEVELAGFWRRFAAGFIDTLVLFIPNIVASMAIPIGGLFVIAAYYLYMMSDQRGGRTLGYQVMGLRLIGQDDHRVKPWKDLGPYAAGLMLLGFIGWIWYLFDDRRRMLHNIFSKTIVVRAA